MKITIRKDQRGLFYRKGEYIRLLPPGEHRYFPFFKETVTVVNVTMPFQADRSPRVYLDDPAFAEETVRMEVSDHEIALHYADGRFQGLLRAGEHLFWNSLLRHEFQIFDLRKPDIGTDVDPAIFQHPAAAGSFSMQEVASHEKGLLIKNGVFDRVLEPGRYLFWNGPVTATVQKADMRLLQLDVSGQDIMTEDKVGLRLNFVCQYRITDPYRALVEVKSFQDQVYIELQLVLRDYIGSMRLDDILARKREISEYVLSKLRERESAYGVKFENAGLKDIILPGEIRDIMNLVITAEKKAQANIITRREETASARSLLNTARLMDENATLYRLKELEYLERICERIGSISVSGGADLIGTLGRVIGEDLRKAGKAEGNKPG